MKRQFLEKLDFCLASEASGKETERQEFHIFLFFVTFTPQKLQRTRKCETSISLEIDPEIRQHFESLEAEVQKQIPSQTLPNGKYLTSYDLKEKWCSCLKQTQWGTEYLKAKIDFGKARFFEDFQPSKATPEDLENRPIRVVLRVRLVWVAPAQVGLSLEISDVMLGPKAEDDLSCPFAVA